MKNYKDIDRFRPIPFYFLNTVAPEYYTPEFVMQSMLKMKNLGFGGIVLFNKPPTGFDAENYLSDSWFDISGLFIKAARELKMQLWINDGFDFPPGDAAGRIEAVNPELKQYRIRKNDEGRLDIVEVPWGFPAFEEPESSRLFQKFVYEEYYKRFAPYFGDGITGFFSDADNRRINAHTLRKCYEEYYPWCKNFSQLFYDRYNYRVEDELKELFSENASQVKEDYWQLCGELYQSWFANNHKWCQEHNVLYTFHTSDTGPLNHKNCIRSSAFSEGDPLELLSHSDCPGTDHEIFVLDSGTHYDKRYYTPQVTFGGDRFKEHPIMNDTLWDLRAKYAASAAVLNKKERIMCEMFAATNWGATFNDLQRIAAWQIIQGINFIVPHAVHHTFNGVIKFFAPPEFTFSPLRHGVREFNDRLAFWCMAASAGEYLYDYAVVDPTRKVWNNESSAEFFHFCNKLNRSAAGYIIVPEGYAGDGKTVIDPLQNIPELPADSVTFDGGELAYMRRKIDGTEYLLAANIWNPETLSGNLSFNGRVCNIELAPGEIAIIGGPFESFRSATVYEKTYTFDGKFKVDWMEDNIVPFDSEIAFEAAENMEIELLIPACNTGFAVFNGRKLDDKVSCKVFDDDYFSYKLNIEKGMNTAALSEKCAFHTPALLRGSFDIAVSGSNDCKNRVYDSYCLAMFEPAEKNIRLSCRSEELSLECGWEKQGQTFYSGGAEIHLAEREFTDGEMLELPSCRDIVELVIDGQNAGVKDVAPYRFSIPSGKHNIDIRIWNTFANRFERYAETSGIYSNPIIVKEIKK